MTRTTKESSAKRARRPSVARRIVSCVTLAAAVATTVSLAGCEEDFDPASKLQTLRVLAVQADKPYPKPRRFLPIMG